VQHAKAEQTRNTAVQALLCDQLESDTCLLPAVLCPSAAP